MVDVPSRATAQTQVPIRSVLVTGLLCALLLGLGGGFLALRAQLRAQPALDRAAVDAAAAVGRDAAGVLERALGFGIPLDVLNGVDAYLERIVGTTPEIARLVVLDPEGNTLYRAPSGLLEVPLSAAEPLRFVLDPEQQGGQRADGREAALLVFTAAPDLQPQQRRLGTAIALAAILGGLAAAAIFGAVTRTWLIQPGLALADWLRHLGRGAVAVPQATVERSLTIEAGQALLVLQNGLMQRFRRVRALANALIAVDYDGTLKDVVDRIMTRLNTRFGDPEALSRSMRTGTSDPATPAYSASGQRWPATALMIGVAVIWGMTWPLTPNFAIDRETLLFSAAWWPSAPVIAEALMFMLGLGAVSAIGYAGQRLIALIGLCLAGAATALAFEIRDYESFALVRTLAGFGTGAALACALTPMRGVRGAVPPSLIVVMAALMLGSGLGGLIGELIGRRATFFTAGSLAVLLLPLPLLIRLSAFPPAAPPRRADGSVTRSWAGFALTGIGIGFSVRIFTASQFALHDYLDVAAFAVLAGIASIAMLLLPRLPILLGGALLSTGLFLLGQYGQNGDLSAMAGIHLLIGAGAGIVLRQCAITGSGHGNTGAVIAFVAGSIIGAAGYSIDAALPVADALIPAIAIVAISLWLATRKPAAAPAPGATL